MSVECDPRSMESPSLNPAVDMPALVSTSVTACSSSCNLWLRWPYVIMSDGIKLEVNLSSGKSVQNVFTTFLDQYSALAVGTGRGANVVHGCDLRNGYLACGTTSGLVLVIKLPSSADGAKVSEAAATAVDVTDAASSHAPAPAPSPAMKAASITELIGHTKVVAFLRLGHDARTLVTSSFDKSVRMWSMLEGVCVQTVKVGTPVMAVEMLPSANAAGTDGSIASLGGSGPFERVVMGCGDGTVRLWDPACKKASKACATLRFCHKEYVGELRLTADGSQLLSWGRDGYMQLWRRDAKHGFVPAAEPLLPPGTSTIGNDFWRIELTTAGLVSVSARGGVQLWRPGGARAPQWLLAESLDAPMAEAPSDVHLRMEADGTLHVAVAGVREPGGGSGGSGGGSTRAVELHMVALQMPPSQTESTSAALSLSTDGTPAAVSGGSVAGVASDGSQGGGGSGSADGARKLPAGWDRWCAVAEMEGVKLDAALQQKLVIMEGVAANTGRELAEATVRSFLRRSAASS